MSYRYGPSLQAAAYTYVRGGLGIPAELVPAEGADGPAYFYGALSLPADNGVELRAVITRWPVLGTLTLDGDDGRFSYTGDSDYILWELRAFNQLTAGDIGHGPGVGRTNLLVGSASELTGAVQLDAAAAAGTMTGGTPSSLTGGVALADVAAAGALAQEGASDISGAVQVEDVLAGGAMTGGAASELGGGVQLDAAQAAGELQGAVVSELGGAVQLGEVMPGGAMAGAFADGNHRVWHVAGRQVKFRVPARTSNAAAQ